MIGIEPAERDPALVEDSPASTDAEATDANQTQDSVPATQQSGCEGYCGTVMGNCAGHSLAYSSYDNCLAVCAQLPQGAAGDERVNSVECRLRAAINAATEPLECASAGPGGNGICGENCENYCELFRKLCNSQADHEEDDDRKDEESDDRKHGESEDDQASSDGVEECERRCQELSERQLQCRLLHVVAAASGLESAQECSYAAGEGVCR